MNEQKFNETNMHIYNYTILYIHFHMNEIDIYKVQGCKPRNQGGPTFQPIICDM